MNHLPGTNLFINICGNIGVGKSTLANALSTEFGIPVFHENVDDHILKLFYKDMQKFSFILQIHLLNQRHIQHQNIIWAGKGGVQDRTIWEDLVFADRLYQMGFMREDELNTYKALFKTMSNFLAKPHLVIYLDADPKVCYDRIQKRGRPMESKISLDYLQVLDTGFRAMIKDLSKTIPVIRIPWDEFQDPKEVAKSIHETYDKLSKVHEVPTISPSVPCS